MNQVFFLKNKKTTFMFIFRKGFRTTWSLKQGKLRGLHFFQLVSKLNLSTPEPLKTVWILFFPVVSGYHRGQTGRHSGRGRIKSCPGCISGTMQYRKFTLCGDMGWGCRCLWSCCNPECTFGLVAISQML